MNKRLLSVLAFALIVSAAASFIVYRLISTRLAAAARPASSLILVASRDLVVGTLIREGDVTKSEYPGALPRGAMLNPEDVIGRGVISPIYAGEPVLENRIAAKGAGAGLAATIPRGMRAVALRVNEIVGVAGFVTPGMRVDVVIAGNPPNPRGNQLGTQTKTVLQNLEVLSAGQDIQKSAEGKPVQVTVVNLLVTPEQAEVLSLAGSETRVQLVLRNPLDTEQAKTPGTALAYLFDGVRKPLDEPGAPHPRAAKPAPPAAAPPPPPPPPIVVEVLHGSKKVDAQFVQEAQPQTAAPEAKTK